jgi:hypothetical protein
MQIPVVPYQNPDVYIGSLRVQEPITVLTDFVFVAMCLYAFLKIDNIKSQPEIKLYRYFFLVNGVSTFVAAILGHAFLYHFGFEIKMYGWLGGILGMSFAQFGSLYHTRKTIGESVFKFLFYFNCLEIIAAFICVLTIKSFVVVEIHSAYSLLLMTTLLESIHYRKTKSAMSKYLIIGVGFLVGAVICHAGKLAMSVWFNHMDLSHVFMTLSVYFMYKGVSRSLPSELAMTKKK